MLLSHFDSMRKFFDSRRELVSSGPGSGGGCGSSGSSHAGGNFIGRNFTVGRHQVTVEEIIAEGERGLQRSADLFKFHACCSSMGMTCALLTKPQASSGMMDGLHPAMQC